jgi:hypothetical protein
MGVPDRVLDQVQEHASHVLVAPDTARDRLVSQADALLAVP